jgi:hypothetical protein
MDLAKYIGLLKRGLFFALPSTIRKTDPWEGSWGGDEDARKRTKLIGLEPEEAERLWASEIDTHHAGLDAIGVSCWHRSAGESVALWSIYVARGMGVAVRSTRARLRSALDVGHRELRIVDVTYEDHATSTGDSDAWTCLSRKRPAYVHEQELRALVALTDDDRSAIRFYGETLGAEPSRQMSVATASSIRMSGHGFHAMDGTAFKRAAIGGIHIRTELDTLIEAVYLPPRVDLAIRRAVEAVSEDAGLPKDRVKETSLDIPPFAKLTFLW